MDGDTRLQGTRAAGLIFFGVNLAVLGWIFGTTAWDAWGTDAASYTRLFPAEVFGALVFTFFWPAILTMLVFPLRSRLGWPVAVDLLQPFGTVLIVLAHLRLALILGAV